MSRSDVLLLAVREILFQEWDPIGVNDNPLCRSEYDGYAPGICRLLRGVADEFKLAAHLAQLRCVSMGLSSRDEEKDRRVARRLLGLKDVGTAAPTGRLGRHR